MCWIRGDIVWNPTNSYWCLQRLWNSSSQRADGVDFPRLDGAGRRGTDLGAAFAEGPGGCTIVCRYAPPGNVVGERPYPDGPAVAPDPDPTPAPAPTVPTPPPAPVAPIPAPATTAAPSARPPAPAATTAWGAAPPTSVSGIFGSSLRVV